MPITTNIVSSNTIQARCSWCNIMWCSLSVTCGRSAVCQWRTAGRWFVSDLRQVGGFRMILRISPPIKLTPRYNWNIAESGVKASKSSSPVCISKLPYKAHIVHRICFANIQSITNPKTKGINELLFILTKSYADICRRFFSCKSCKNILLKATTMIEDSIHCK